MVLALPHRRCQRKRFWLRFFPAVPRIRAATIISLEDSEEDPAADVIVLRVLPYQRANNCPGKVWADNACQHPKIIPQGGRPCASDQMEIQIIMSRSGFAA